MTYDFIFDAGHGWLKVPRAELVRLGILEEVTSCSYQRDTWVYLEEDVDAKTFIKAKKQHGEKFKYRERNCNAWNRVRNYASFRP